MKTLFRYVLAAMLAVTVYSFSNGATENIVVADDPNEMYKVTDPNHPSFGITDTRQNLEPECQAGLLICAKPVNPESESSNLTWSGPTKKF